MIIIYLDCNELQSLKEGNETKWGCSAASNSRKCSETKSWWAKCCSWDTVGCTSKHQGKYLHKTNNFQESY